MYFKDDQGPSWSWSYGSEFEFYSWQGVLDATLCDKVGQWRAAIQWFSLGTPVSSTNKAEPYNIIEILLKVVLNTITITLKMLKGK
jgi:hypothetical protein